MRRKPKWGKLPACLLLGSQAGSLRHVFRGALYLTATIWLAIKLTPVPDALLRPPVQSRELTDCHGQTLRQTRVEERFSREVSLDEVPINLIHAMLAAEDKRFFRHQGVDLLAVVRAAWTSFRCGRITSGASTITQQLVKLAQPRPRTLPTKVIEAVTALRIEQLWTKDEILAAYLNRLDFGNSNVGVAAAAGYYFGKPLADLSDAECALVAGLPNNPTRLNPHTAPKAAQRRQRTVLGRMRDNGWLTSAQCERAGIESLRLLPPRRQFHAPHFVDLVLRGLPPEAPASVRTTLDLDLNRFVERSLDEQLARLRGQSARNAAAVVIENATGNVLALVGSEDFFAPGSGQVNGAWARRSAGSTLKPFTYLLALERGATPATVVADVPAVFATSTGLYQPENYNRRCYGPMRYRMALANSLNIPAVKVLASLGGAPVLHQRLRDWGLTTLEKPAESYGLGLTIGNAEARLLELANAYAALARLGEFAPYRLVAEGRGMSIPRSAAPGLHPAAEHTWLIADILSDNAARTLAFGAHSPLRFEFPVACKTGTSSDFRDNWALGYTPEFTVGVWVGNFDGSAMHEVSGVSGAAPVLHAVFTHLHQRFGTTWYSTPAAIVQRHVHPLTGKIVARPGPDSVTEKFRRDLLPATESPEDYDGEGRVKLGPAYQSWLASGNHGLDGRVAAPARQETVRVVSPVPGTMFVVDPDLPTSRQVPLLAQGSERLEWKSSTLECRVGEGRAYALAREGEHEIEVHDSSTGRTARTWIRVKSL